MLLVIDNYDSFVHNLSRYFRQLGMETKTVRNDSIDCDSVRRLQPEAIIISPGPCTPGEAGICLEVIKTFADSIPMLGVCLGHQAIVQSLGGRVVQAWQPVHGRASEITHAGSELFKKVPDTFSVGRYHSLVAEPKTLPDCLRVTSKTSDGVVMSVEHKSRPIVGMQFHPESILTQHGHQLLKNFLTIAECLPKQGSSQHATSCEQLMQQEIATGGVIL
jgi:anthranilate synthase/aminodeoxychorismate synthase-like glutamine amidotransferase